MNELSLPKSKKLKNRTKKYKYDIALSFLSKDEPLATELHDRLSENLDVFVYSKKQEDVAGTDGLESFRAVFRNDCLMVVVLYRNGWGKTRWTRVEEDAIKERCFDEGWDNLFFIMVDESSTPPKWLPKSNIRLNLNDYGVEQAVGAIKGRLQELGGKLKKESALTRAKILEHQSNFREEKKSLFCSEEGVNSVLSEVGKVFKEIEKLSAEIMERTKFEYLVGHNGSKCVITNRVLMVTLNLYWIPYARNRVEGSKLIVIEAHGTMSLPGENKRFLRQPKILSEHEFVPDYTPGKAWCWRESGIQAQNLSSGELADYCSRLFLGLMDKADRGVLKAPSILD